MTPNPILLYMKSQGAHDLDYYLIKKSADKHNMTDEESIQLVEEIKQEIRIGRKEE